LVISQVGILVSPLVSFRLTKIGKLRTQRQHRATLTFICSADDKWIRK